MQRPPKSCEDKKENRGADPHATHTGASYSGLPPRQACPVTRGTGDERIPRGTGRKFICPWNGCKKWNSERNFILPR